MVNDRLRNFDGKNWLTNRIVEVLLVKRIAGCMETHWDVGRWWLSHEKGLEKRGRGLI